MVYLIYGEEKYLINNKVNEIINGRSFIKIDGSLKSFSIDDLIREIENYNLFIEEKIIAVYDPFFLKQKVDDNKVDELIKCVERNINDIELLLISNLSDFNFTFKISKYFKKIGNEIKYNKLSNYDFFNYINNYVKDENMIFENINYFINMLNNDLTKFHNEIDKLKLLNQKISNKIIDEIVVNSAESNIFELIELYLKKDYQKCFEKLNLIFLENNNIHLIIAIFSTQIRFYNHIQYLLSQNKNEKEIIEITKAKSFRIIKSIDLIKSYDIDFLKILSDLSKIDQITKTNDLISQKDLMEMFILNIDLKNLVF